MHPRLQLLEIHHWLHKLATNDDHARHLQNPETLHRVITLYVKSFESKGRQCKNSADELLLTDKARGVPVARIRKLCVQFIVRHLSATSKRNVREKHRCWKIHMAYTFTSTAVITAPALQHDCRVLAVQHISTVCAQHWSKARKKPSAMLNKRPKRKHACLLGTGRPAVPQKKKR